MSMNPLSVTLPLTPNSTFTSTPHFNRVPLGAKKLPEDSLQKLPFSWFTKIMTCLDPYSICVLTSVSASLYNSFEEERWQPLCQQFFPESYKKHTERLKSSPPESRHFFMGKFNLIKGRLNFNAQQRSVFFFKEALNDDHFLLQNRVDKCPILWNTKEGRAIKRWERHPIQRHFAQIGLDAGSVLDGRAVILNSLSYSVTIHDLIGENKIITLPNKDSVNEVIPFGKSQIIYKTFRKTEGSIEERFARGEYNDIWKIWDVFKEKITILWPDAPHGFVENVYVLDDERIVTLSAKILTVWHVASQQVIRTYTAKTINAGRAVSITVSPVILNKRWFVYTVSESGEKVKVWDTSTGKTINLPIFSPPQALWAFNERLLICKMSEQVIKIIDILESHRQRDLPNFLGNPCFLSLNNGCIISYGSTQIGIWDDSAYQERLLKGTHSSTSSSSSDSSSSSNSSEQHKAINSSSDEEKG